MVQEPHNVVELPLHHELHMLPTRLSFWIVFHINVDMKPLGGGDYDAPVGP